MTLGPAPCELKPHDFASNQEVRWCPGCGDYAILAVVKKTLAKLKMERSRTVFVSGIGCSSRFPYYVNTYGFHSIHGRAPTIATGLKLARPDLNVWVMTGDGDALAIGGNHFMHMVRRNVDLKVIMFNNRIYGLTKGQYSPTSEQGKKTKSSPVGTVEAPVRPISVALGCEATFVARALDADVKHLEYVIERAAKHKGTAFVEVYQNCVIFNDGAYGFAGDRDARTDSLLYLEHGKPLVFGKNRDKGIRLKGWSPEVVNVADVNAAELAVHDELNPNSSAAFLLSRMRHPEFPEPVGVFRAVEQPTYDDLVHGQIDEAVARRGEGNLQELVTGPETWKVE